MRLFISHSSRDKKFVLKLDSDLKSVGYSTMLDTYDFSVGSKIERSILKGIDECEFVLLVLSPAAVRSQWVQKEMKVALERKASKGTHKLFTVVHKKCRIPRHLQRFLYADFTEDYEFAFRKLLFALPGARHDEILQLIKDLDLEIIHGRNLLEIVKQAADEETSWKRKVPKDFFDALKRAIEKSTPGKKPVATAVDSFWHCVRHGLLRSKEIQHFLKENIPDSLRLLEMAPRGIALLEALQD